MATQTQTTTPDHIAAAIQAGISPFLHGSLDASARRPCCPDEYLWDDDQAEYVEGYCEQADATLEQSARSLGLMVLAMTGGPELDELVQTLEYEDWQEDVEWLRGGM